ncbi:hypothetical protein [Streptomyces sp. NPDC056669]|uniref:hypothetical protein n=1 Tax=Streptomyces sp. NPDC056669 TaxID=3345903 RepID=UPI0036845621
MAKTAKWVQLLWQEQKFKLIALESAADRFEDLFTRIMRRVNEDSFHVARAAGSAGDMKCDGWDSESKTLYAVYAPFSRKGNLEIRGKIRSDFYGAVKRWPEMRNWRFVHNDLFGLSATATRELEALRSESSRSDVKILSDWSPQELWGIFRALPECDRLDLLGGPSVESLDGDQEWLRDVIPHHEAVHPAVVRSAVAALSSLCGNFQPDAVLDPVCASVLARALTAWWLGEPSLFEDCLDLLMEQSDVSPFETQLTALGFLIRCTEICAARMNMSPEDLLRSQLEYGDHPEGFKVILQVALDELRGEGQGFYIEGSETRKKFIQACAKWTTDFLGMAWAGGGYPAIFALQDLITSMQRLDFNGGVVNISSIRPSVASKPR